MEPLLGLRQEIEGQWNQVKGQVQERWGELTDDDLYKARGSADQLVGVIQQKTGSLAEQSRTSLSRRSKTAAQFFNLPGHRTSIR
ncbi:MAG: CsbD family protein [Planctomycetaceae bacterium]